MNTDQKTWYYSKTMWLAAVQAAVAIVLVYQGQYPDAGYILVAKSCLDILLRYITTTTVLR